MTNRRIPQLLVPLTAVLLALSACSSGSDDASGDTSEAASTTAASVAETGEGTTATTSTDTGSTSADTGSTAADTGSTESSVADASPTTLPEGAPTATLPAEVPEAYLPAFRPVDVIGESLPVLETDDVAADPAVGTPAPVLVGYDTEGNPIRIDPATDGPTMIAFVAHWCGVCNEEVPKLVELSESGAFDDINVVAVMTGSDPSAPNFPPDQWLSTAMNWPYPAMFDGVSVAQNEAGETGLALTAMNAFGGSAYPYIVLVDGDGNVAARWAGARDSATIQSNIETYLG